MASKSLAPRFVFCMRLRAYRLLPTLPSVPPIQRRDISSSSAVAAVVQQHPETPPLPIIGKPGDPFYSRAAQEYLMSELSTAQDAAATPVPAGEVVPDHQPLYPPTPARHRTIAQIDPLHADPPEPDPTIPPETIGGNQATAAQRALHEALQQPFNSLKDKIEHKTLKALTVRPFSHKLMSAVQTAVLSLMPDLITPGSRKDILVKAPPGSGKTLSYVVPAIEGRLKAIDEFSRQAVKDAGRVTDQHLKGRAARVFTRGHVGALILVPTRELATEVANTALKASYGHPNFEVRLFVGGIAKKQQMRDFMKGRRDIVVSTPGRLRDLLVNENEIVKGIAKTQMLIIDECDMMLDMGFRDDLDAIATYLPDSTRRQTFIYSGTLSPAVQQMAKNFLLKDHLYVSAAPPTPEPIHLTLPQFHTVLPSPAHQLPHIVRLIASDQLTNPGRSKVVIHVPTDRTATLFTTLIRALSPRLPSARDTHIYEMHSNRTAEQRALTSAAFRTDPSGAAVLITSEISTRGVTYAGVTRAIQLGIPPTTDSYKQRVRGVATWGRSDLVLLPWEIGFLTWQLEDFPLKPTTVSAVTEEVEKLAKEHDADPDAWFRRPIQDAAAIRYYPKVVDAAKVHPFAAPVAPRVSGITQAYEELLPSIDDLAVKETFASLLGYYIPKSPEVRTSREVIVQGCKDWAVGACGLEREPFVSDEFLRRLGMDDGRTKHFGRAYQRFDIPQMHTNADWQGRGRQATKGLVRNSPDWHGNLEAPLHPLDPPGPAPENLRTQRYNTPEWRKPNVKEELARQRAIEGVSDPGSNLFRAPGDPRPAAPRGLLEDGREATGPTRMRMVSKPEDLWGSGGEAKFEYDADPAGDSQAQWNEAKRRDKI